MIEDKLIYNVVVGYMLKVIKSGVKITKFKEEFNAIKHGDYVCFINLIKVGIPKDIIVAKEGEDELISTEKQMGIKNADFIFLFLSAPALIEFYSKCYQEFGEIIDNDLSDEDFESVANFEMVLRMFFNNLFINKNRIDLINVIDVLLNDKGIPKSEIEIVQHGRKFINMIKGHPAKFSSIHEGLIAFRYASNILKKHEITVL